MEEALSVKVVEFLVKKEMKLAKEIRKRRSSDEAYAFIIAVLRKTISKSITKEELKEIIFDGDNEEGFDVINIKPQIVEVYDIKNTASSFSESEINTFLENIKKYIFQKEELPSRCPKILRTKIEEVVDKIDNKKFKLKIYFIRNGKDKPAEWVEKKANKVMKLEDVEIKYLNRIDIISEICGKDTGNNLEFTFTEDRTGIDSERTHLYEKGKILITRVNINSLLEGLVKSGKNVNYNLYHGNVRDFLGEKEPSRGMLSTLKDFDKDFHLFHNGITISCEEINPVREHGGRFSVRNPVVLNGCQTLETLYKNYSGNLKDEILAKASILCRFFVLDSLRAAQVCQASNTQNKIEPWELRSNDNEQKLIEFYLNNIAVGDFKYKRKNGKSIKGNISLPELGQWLYAAVFKKPAEAKNNKKEIFEIDRLNPIYDQLFKRSKIKPADLIRVCRIGVFLKKAKKQKEVNKRKKVFGLDKDLEFSLIKSADFHIMTAFYYKNLKLNDENLQLIIKKIYRVTKLIQKEKGAKYDIKRAFTQDAATWSKIKGELNKA